MAGFPIPEFSKRQKKFKMLRISGFHDLAKKLDFQKPGASAPFSSGVSLSPCPDIDLLKATPAVGSTMQRLRKSSAVT